MGIHWQFDADEGIKVGNNVGDYVFAHASFRPFKNKDEAGAGHR